jgi:hypothetical protein
MLKKQSFYPTCYKAPGVMISYTIILLKYSGNHKVTRLIGIGETYIGNAETPAWQSQWDTHN